jgi:vitamin B12 transporter
LVLIDGMRVAALGTGAFTWEQLALNQIERIEIVRGPRAALWGSDAIGGVIQFFTRRTDGADASVSLGNHEAFATDVGAGWRSERGGFDLRLGYADVGGVSAQNEDGFAFDPDADGFRHRNALLHGDVALGEHRLDAVASRRDNDVAFDQGNSQTKQTQYGVTLSGDLDTELGTLEDWNHRLAVSSSRDTLITPDFFSRYDSRREQLDWVNEFAVGAASDLVLGLGYVRERGLNLDTFAGEPVYAARRHNRAAFATWKRDSATHDFEASVRHDENSQFGGESTFGAAWGWEIGGNARTVLSWGEGFRAPTLNELYSPGFGGLFAGNPLLAPERSRSVEAGLDLDLGLDATLGLRAYRNEIRDLVDFSGGETFQAINIGRVRIDGVELSGRWELGAWALDGNATWQDAENQDTGTDLLRRPSRKATLAVDRRFDNGARFGIEGHAASTRPEFGGDLPGYGIVSLRGNLPLTESLTLDARIENLFDRDYVLVRGFNTPGMTALLTLRWEH